MNQNILGGVVCLIILGVFLFANNANKSAEQSRTACYKTIENASGMSDAYKIKAIKACNT